MGEEECHNLTKSAITGGQRIAVLKGDLFSRLFLSLPHVQKKKKYTDSQDRGSPVVYFCSTVINALAKNQNTREDDLTERERGGGCRLLSPGL